MSLPGIFASLDKFSTELQTNEILGMNDESKKYGLVLTPREAKEIVEARKHVLLNYGRIELDIEITKKFIQAFCSSPFISQEDYVQTLNELHEIFYYLKNETEDKIGDEELVMVIKDFFDNSCGGSMELLKDRLETIAGEVRRNNQIKESLEEE